MIITNLRINIILDSHTPISSQILCLFDTLIAIMMPLSRNQSTYIFLPQIGLTPQLLTHNYIEALSDNFQRLFNSFNDQISFPAFKLNDTALRITTAMV